jgi:O-antigen ligase
LLTFRTVKTVANEITLQRGMPEILIKEICRPNSPRHHRSSEPALGKSSIFALLSRRTRLSLRYSLFLVGAIWPLILLTPHLPGIPRPGVGGLPWRQELGLSVLLTLALSVLTRHRQKISRIRIEQPTLLVSASLGLFVIWTSLSTFWSATPSAAIHLSLQWTMYLGFFLVMSSVAKSPKLLHSSLVALAGIVCMLAIACAIESWFGAPLTDGNLRSDLKPILRGSGGFGEIMAMAAILFASLSLHLNRRRIALACGVTAILGWLATLQTLERAPFIGASIGFALLIVGTAVTRLRFRQSPKRLFLLIGALAGILLLQTMPSLTSSANGSTSTVSRLGQNLIEDSNTRVRFLFWGVGLEMLRAHPFLGVGGNNYETAFPAAREQFAKSHSGSPLVGMNEEFLTVYAHNEYLQILAELGLIGFALFVILSLAFVANFWHALKHRKQTLPVLGAGGAMLAFAVSSGASGSSFRYLGGGLFFFFAAAIITRVTESSPPQPTSSFTLNCRLSRPAFVVLSAVMLLVVGFFSTQATGTVLHGLAQSNAEPTQAERYYRASLIASPSSPATHFTYGLWLYDRRRAPEAASHLSYAVDHGFNSSICYAYLAGAQELAGDQLTAEQTLAKAVRTYPVSVFLLVRHSVALERAGRPEESAAEFAKALRLNSRTARGWQQLIVNDVDAALDAAKHDTAIALPGELVPEGAVFEVLHENEQRFPEVANRGVRARLRRQQSR